MTQMPAGDPKMPDLLSEIRALRAEVAAMRKKTVEEPKRDPKVEKVFFSHSGVVTTDPSTYWDYPEPEGYLTAVKFHAHNAPMGGDVLLHVWCRDVETLDQNARLLAELKIKDGVYFYIEDDLMAEVSELDRVWVQFSFEVGGGSSRMALEPSPPPAVQYPPSHVTVVLHFAESVG